MTVSERSEKCESFQQHALTVSGKGEEFSAGDDVPDGDGVGCGGGQDVVCGGVEGDRLDAARLLGQGQLGGGDAAGGQRLARRRQAPQLDLKMGMGYPESAVVKVMPCFGSLKAGGKHLFKLCCV